MENTNDTKPALKGKDLKVGMNVICLKTSKKSPIAAMSGTPLTVKALELPFVVFSGERKVMRMPTLFGPVAHRN